MTTLPNDPASVAQRALQRQRVWAAIRATASKVASDPKRSESERALARQNLENLKTWRAGR